MCSSVSEEQRKVLFIIIKVPPADYYINSLYTATVYSSLYSEELCINSDDG